MYLTVKQNYRIQIRLAGIQEKARLISYLLSKNIRTTGYSGCFYNFIPDIIHGYTGDNAPSYIRNKIKPNSDIVILKTAANNVTQLTRDINPPAKTLHVVKNPATPANSTLLISDCTTAKFIKADNFSGNIIKINKPLRHQYKKADTEIGRYTETAYFICKTSSDSAKSQIGYALCTITNKKNKQEILDGIQNLKIKYGIDTNNDGKVNNYLTASQIIDWRQVKSAAITITFNMPKGTYKTWKFYAALREKNSKK